MNEASRLIEDAVNVGTRMASQLGRTLVTENPMLTGLLGRTSSFDPACGPICCPPKDECPPRCLLRLSRRARPGEVILVPFQIRNASGQPKQYQLGVHPLLDQHGNPAPTQPTLSTTQIQVPPGHTRVVEMRLDLSNYQAGNVYETDIVVREKEVNQNICFTLTVESGADAPVATPHDEQKLQRHFVHWHHHYYCEEPRRRQPEGDVADG